MDFVFKCSLYGKHFFFLAISLELPITRTTDNSNFFRLSLKGSSYRESTVYYSGGERPGGGQAPLIFGQKPRPTWLRQFNTWLWQFCFSKRPQPPPPPSPAHPLTSRSGSATALVPTIIFLAHVIHTTSTHTIQYHTAGN